MINIHNKLIYLRRRVEIMQIMINAEEKVRVVELERAKKSLELQLSEMAKMVAKQQEIIAQSKRDPLTGLRNRAGVSDQINNIVKNKKEGTFFIMDMDNFKSVNDTYGHIEGDKVLVRFAMALKKAVDANDIVARLGGDEFIIFSQGSMDTQCIKEKAIRIIRQIEKGLVSPGKLLKVTVSMGIAQAPFDGMTYESLYENADKALYCVKNEGKNNFKFYNEIKSKEEVNSIRRTQVSFAEITAKLREKKMEGSFVVEYNNFEKIYRFMERNIAREKREVQCVLFTLDDKNGTSDEYEVQRHMEHLQYAVASSLRKGDVTTKYSSSQMLALLMDVNKENAKIVINRIMDKYQNVAGEGCMNVDYDSDQLMEYAD